MAEAVGQLKRLKVVQFGDCLVRTEGAKSLAAALDAGHEFLEELVLSHNEIRVEGALAVLNTVVRKPGLKKLDLDGELGRQVRTCVCVCVCVMLSSAN